MLEHWHAFVLHAFAVAVLFDFVLFGSKELEDFGELVFIKAKAVRKELDAKSEEFAIVVSVEYRVLNVADQVLEESTDHDVNYLNYLHVDFKGLLRLRSLLAANRS